MEVSHVTAEGRGRVRYVSQWCTGGNMLVDVVLKMHSHQLAFSPERIQDSVLV